MNRYCLLLFGLAMVICSANARTLYSQQPTAFQTPSSLNLSPLASSADVGEPFVEEAAEKDVAAFVVVQYIDEDLQKLDRTGSPVSSLSELLLDRADELEAGEPTASLDNESVQGTDTNDEADAADQQSLRDRITAAHLSRLRKPTSEIRLSVTEPGERVPENIAAVYSQEKPLIMIAAMGNQPLPPNRYTVCFKHRPLYYEQTNLERCGHGHGYFENAISGIQFIANTIMLPYQLGAEPADCPIPSGGDCMTCQSLPVELNLCPLDFHALLSESAATAGFTFLLL